MSILLAASEIHLRLRAGSSRKYAKITRKGPRGNFPAGDQEGQEFTIKVRRCLMGGLPLISSGPASRTRRCWRDPKATEKLAKDMMRNDEKMSDEDMEDDDSSVRAEPRVRGDWSSLHVTLETAFGSMGNRGGANRNRRGAVIDSRECKGHWQYECKDGCQEETCFGDLKDIMFPGAFAKEPLGSLQRAWVVACTFIRNDMNTAEKIKAWKKGVAGCLDAEALQRVLQVVYDRCKDCAELLHIYTTDGISKYERIDYYSFKRDL
ncbi:unnamed protein product [Haemonchus placei]|uniref:Annexin n=1 Tax=Haemonchus placei TaxID=6290 RepID=A0A0N4W189_HAEPC|nr:unnamed protein product [Haemonchus placei]